MKFVITTFVIASLSLNGIKAQTDLIAPAVPQGVQAFGYEKNIDVEWYNNNEPDIAGYNIYIKSNQEFNLFTNVSREKSYYSISVPVIGVSHSFKVSAYDSTGNESTLSDSVYAIAHSMTDDEFLDMVQRSTFRYFWDWGDPNSGIARERWHPDESDVTNTTGGGGFGVMAILVGIERGFVTREQGSERILKIVDFLANKIIDFHGAFPHWFNGTTGEVVNFGVQDGGDIVETSFMIQGLLAARQYFDQQNATEDEIRNLITQLWQNVNWDFYRNNSGGLYWNWSPTWGFNFSDTFIFHGWNETLIAYILAIASPEHAVNLPAPSFYRSGWGNNGLIYVLRQKYGYLLYVGTDYGGPLFFTHYSFLGFDPRNKKDMYTNYFTHNKNQALVNWKYCTNNPKGFEGYGEDNWGLTASNSIPGVWYSAHEPNNDNGTIAPTAAISSMPYTPDESIAALKHFYRTYGSDLWGDFGFKDAFNLTYSSQGVLGQWFSDGYLAIDQGPIIVMIENYRSKLLWNLFMANSEIDSALTAIGFVPDPTDVNDEIQTVSDFKLLGNYPNPFNPTTTIQYNIPVSLNPIKGGTLVTLKVYDILGREIATLVNEEKPSGRYEVQFDASNLSSGSYFYKLTGDSKSLLGKMILQK